MSKEDVKTLEAEMQLLEKSFLKADDRIRENGGANRSFWAFRTRAKISRIKKRIDDLKTGNKRVDELTPQELEIEKKLARVESKLAVK